MRIIAGQHRGTILADVGKGDVAAHLRPTSDRVRENLFNVLQGGRYGELIGGAHVLDLFAGTGALGLEALSRGAASVTFVENGMTSQKLIRSNIAKLRRQNDCNLLESDALSLPQAPQTFDLIFLDPPYGKQLGQASLLRCKSNGWFNADATIVWEENTAQIPPVGFSLLDQRRYGDTWITILKFIG